HGGDADKTTQRGGGDDDDGGAMLKMMSGAAATTLVDGGVGVGGVRMVMTMVSGKTEKLSEMSFYIKLLSSSCENVI
nr:hypothetical protein [Tanacetum cinerariifolium]